MGILRRFLRTDTTYGLPWCEDRRNGLTAARYLCINPKRFTFCFLQRLATDSPTDTCACAVPLRLVLVLLCFVFSACVCA